MGDKKWRSTKLWKLISNKETESSKQVKGLLENSDVMDKIEKILSKGSTSGKDFTLHDEEHSFRVAERMIEIIPKESIEILSEYDLMMLLLSAYLHDIGMTPDYKKIHNYFVTLTTEDKTNLSNEEINELQKWLDNENEEIDIRKEHLKDYNKAIELMTYFARYKHNDWSETWILENLSIITVPGYLKWQNDLINICKSHHYGLTELVKDKYDPKLLSGICCHRRFVAICLRVADVLDIDPERTPEVLFKHRNIAENSVPYWLKDQEIIINIHNGTISFSARPQRAYLYKAVEETVKQIENELNLCNNLIAQKPLSFIAPSIIRNYSWKLEIISNDIKPFENSFEYIKGSFRPNTTRILDLLGGTELYGEKIVAVREILQNSFDAVKERIAYHRLSNLGSDTETEKTLGDIYGVKIKLEHSTEGTWMIVKDHGVGMTKDIIENYFLVSGASQRHQLTDLSRRCLKEGIPFERTGQFGIGVLSYFMIADKIIIRSKRAQDCGFGDKELIGWEFEIGGLQDFGELKKINIIGAGTELRLLLKSEMLYEEKENFENKLIKYIKDIIISVPCKLEVQSCSSNDLLFNTNTGWVSQNKNLEDTIIYEDLENRYETEPYIQKPTYYDLISNSFSNISESNKKDFSFFVDDFKEKIRWLNKEGDLPDNFGKYKISIPFFDINGNNSFFYFHFEKVDFELKILEFSPYNSLLKPSFYTSNKLYSWKGFEIKFHSIGNYDFYSYDSDYQDYNNVNVIIDLNSGPFSISVNRKTLSISKEINYKINTFISEQIQKSIGEIVLQNVDDIFLFSNLLYLQKYDRLRNVEYKYCFFKSIDLGNNREVLTFKKIEFPFILWNKSLTGSNYFYNQKKILEFDLDYNHKRSISIFQTLFKFKVCFFRNKYLGNSLQFFLVAINELDNNSLSIHNDFILSEFPSKWDKLILIFEESKENNYHIVNVLTKNSNLLNTQSELNGYNINNIAEGGIEEMKAFYLENQEFILGFFLDIFMNGNWDNRWENMLKNELSFFKKIWESAFGKKETVFFINAGNSTLNEVSISSWKEINISSLEDFFPPIGNDFMITEEP